MLFVFSCKITASDTVCFIAVDVFSAPSCLGQRNKEMDTKLEVGFINVAFPSQSRVG